MNKKAILLAKHVLGEELYQKLEKAIVKMPTRSVVDIQEVHSALRIAPKSVMTFLMKETNGLADGEAKNIKLPFDDNTSMLLNKHTADVYSGHMYRGGKIIHEFQNASIPQLSSHLLSLFELYDEELNYKERSSREESSKESSHKGMAKDGALDHKFSKLEEKVDKLFMLIAQQKPAQVIVNVSDRKGLSKAEVLKKPYRSEAQRRWAHTEAGKASIDTKEWDKESKGKKLPDRVKKALQKAGLMPKMPSTPKAGSNVGGTSGTTKGGIHSPKTATTDFNLKAKTQITAPGAKPPSAPKPTAGIPKMPAMKSEYNIKAFSKSEINLTCSDCGNQATDCLCLKGLSKPVLLKSTDQYVAFKFENDWDHLSIEALYTSLKKTK